MTPLLHTKLLIPPPRPRRVARPQLLARLNAALPGRLSLISAPAGFGKTTLVSEWVAHSERPAAWLSLDEGDNDPYRFLAYLIAALQTVAPTVGPTLLAALHAPQPPALEWALTTFLNEVTLLPEALILVLDDYHAIEAHTVHEVLAFLLARLPAQLHLTLTTREDPPLPLARLRARGQLVELRAAELRFTPSESAGFLNQVMGLALSEAEIAALAQRTEGWVAGLQLAALSLQGQPESASFIDSFTGSHHFVLDYLVEEVLQQQPTAIQRFLLDTSILPRLCGPLCDAVRLAAAPTGQQTLEYLERANLFLIPLDSERRWYRYHHLFAELLRQRRSQAGIDEAPLHQRASQWYEEAGLLMEAFEHAVAAQDVARAERLIEGPGLPRHLRGTVQRILAWLDSLPRAVLDARPTLWWRWGSLLLMGGQTTGVAEKLQAAETALQAASDAPARALRGQIATARAVLALTRYEVATMRAQAQQALAYLPPEAQATRASAQWVLGQAHLFQGEHPAARTALQEALALSQRAADPFTTLLALIGLGAVAEAALQLDQAATYYQQALTLGGDQPLQILNEAHLGLARLHYAWDELAQAEVHGLASLRLARQYDQVIDRFILAELFLVRLALAQGKLAEARRRLARARQAAAQPSFAHRQPEVAALQVALCLHQGQLTQAASLVQAHVLPLSQARLQLAQGAAGAALVTLAGQRPRVEAAGQPEERLGLLLLQALAHQAQGELAAARICLDEALAMAEPGRIVRPFVDEGPPMAQLLMQVSPHPLRPTYVARLLAACQAARPTQPLIEPLSPRELEVLRLLAQGLSNQEIGARLFITLDTVKGHNRRLYGKLQVRRRTEAVAKARELGLL